MINKQTDHMKNILSKWLKALVGTQPFWLIIFLYCITVVENNIGLLPLYVATGNFRDHLVVSLLKSLSLLTLYLPYTKSKWEQYAIIGVAIFGCNTYSIWRQERNTILDLLWGGALTGYVVARSLSVFGKKHGTILSIAVVSLSSFSAILPPFAACIQILWLFAVWHYQIEKNEMSICRCVYVLSFGIGNVGILIIICIILSMFGHSIYQQFVKYNNFSGLDLCIHKVDELYPTSIQQIQELVTNYTSLRAAGFGHSWNPYTCPDADGLILKMQEIRSIRFEKGAFVTGAGTTMGTLVNFMMKHGYELPASWVSDISVGGAISTGVHNNGVGFFECCIESVTLIDGNAELVVVDSAHSAWKFIPGSIGRLGIVVEARVRGQPLHGYDHTSVEYTWDSVSTVVDAVKRMKQTETLWILHDVLVVQNRLQLAHYEKPDGVYERFELQKQYVNSVSARRFFASILNSCLTIFPIITYYVLNSNYNQFREYVNDLDRDEIHYTKIPEYVLSNKKSRLQTLKQSVVFSTIEIDIVLSDNRLAECLDVMLDPNAFFPLMHVRRAQRLAHPLVPFGDYYHVDFSIPTWTLSRFHPWIQNLQEACIVDFSHPGKATLELLEKYRDTNRVPSIKMPPQFNNTEFNEMIRNMDPRGRFAPQSMYILHGG